jgi:hypothetical protein
MAALPLAASAQDESDLMDAGEFVDQNYLELANNVLSIFPPVPEEGVEAYNKALNDLIAVYESEVRSASSHGDELKDMVEEAKKQEDIVDAKVDVAKKAEDEAEKERLEALKETHKDRREYLERIRKIREQEVKVQEARVDHLKALREGVEKAAQLSSLRSKSDAKVRDLLGVEEEMIKLSKEIAEKNDKLAGEAKKLNNWREDAFKERQKILEDLEKVRDAG